MKYTLKALALVGLMLFTAQCEFIDEDLLTSPNSVSPDQVDPDFLLNEIQMDTRSVFATASGIGANLSRMRYLFGTTYGNAYTANNFNGVYTTGYSGVLIDVKNLLEIGEARGLEKHMGVAKILQAYVMLMVVDMYGNAPYEEALQGGENFNPALEDGSSIYSKAITLLDEAIVHLDTEVPFPADDLYFGDASDQEAAWTKLAKTLQLKAHLNTGNATAANALITEGDLILANADNFVFRYSTNDTDPDSRHPLFGANYDNLAGSYMSVGYMNLMLNDKFYDNGSGNSFSRDPRVPYYFYRQTTAELSSFSTNENRCITESAPGHFGPDDPFCIIYDPDGAEVAGYWGRDHLIDDGIPPDNGLRTTFGVYPVGGKYDVGAGGATDRDDGLAGAGMEPMLMSSFTHFMIAEVELELNSDPAAARASLETAIRRSMNAVADFADGEDTVSPITNAGIDDYVDYVLFDWDTNTAPADRLETLATEYYIALFPNGYEAYNLLRRTGEPRDALQPAKNASPGDWFYTLLYPSNMVERNSNVTQKERTERVFWDTRGATFDF